MEILVSIIMSEYNTEETKIRKAIESMLNQTYCDFEFIIINDGSTNNLENIINSYKDERIRLIHNEENIGLAKSLNKAVEYSRGKYLVRMDTDDISYPDRIEKQLDFIMHHPEYSVVGTSINLMTDQNLFPKKYGQEIDKTDLMNRIAPVHPSVILDKKALEQVGKYDTENVGRSEDFVLWSKMLLAGYRIYVMEDILLDYRVELEDYKKRRLSTRKDEVLNRLKYYKKMGASPLQYVLISKSILAGILPAKLMAWYQNRKYN